MNAKVRLKDPMHWTEADGTLVADLTDPSWTGAFSEVPYVDKSECAHDNTMCVECRADWECDYEVVVELV